MKFSTSSSFIFGFLALAQLTTTHADYHIACGGKTKKCPMDYAKVPEDSGSLFGARCCSEMSFENCEDPKSNCSVYAGSKGPDKECFLEGTHDDAVQFCTEQVNARLCTCNEVLNKCAKGTGCGLNKQMVWCAPDQM
mmetsp:Transcript_6503/g.8087  ORF Transcript_6503/g.8087 Transcript_6503/m.8087 type:complete len:137 (-) Transcript_6503:130-540(-)|eukprot:CAMPEP_0203652452 /NCGR_PEP_ID=MMETSP0088-20131115/30126_1 /ASSEMBLY_ACC=CAM_ASM_001087 /TAXON_ID=426623 /ORGANISM="Chaetoceros affinis, Strain CCMP159" /LENGTH=136 /DNA_ID=CAMNT_0050511997 /DNA_START=56 /DNA_END=466 /DNA_ORIENTATION=-